MDGEPGPCQQAPQVVDAPELAHGVEASVEDAVAGLQVGEQSLEGLGGRFRLRGECCRMSSCAGKSRVLSAPAKAPSFGSSSSRPITSQTLQPKRLQTVVDYSLQTTRVAPGFEDFVMDVMLAASDRQMAAQILGGSGVAPNVTGILNTTGILTNEYMSADKGSQVSFFDAEDSLGLDVPSDRRAWILGEDLFRKARRTVRDPGDATYVLRRWDGAMRVLDNTMAIRSNVLSTGYGLYGEWSACTLGIWATVLVTIDRITTPGTLKVTVDRYFDFVVTRAARFAVLQEA